MLAVISAALGTTSLFYSVLDNGWVTLIGVLLTFALLVQFASVLSDVEREPAFAGERSWLRTFVANPRRLVESIVDFAEVARFIDTPVKLYSSGMYVRLAFSVAAHLNPEIVILDEVLAVGDAVFQKKCFDFGSISLVLLLV